MALPGLGLPAALAGFVLRAWFMALQYADYPMANHGIDFTAQRRHLRHRHWLAMSFGSALMVLSLVPVVNFLAMPIAVASAMAMWVGGTTGARTKREAVELGLKALIQLKKQEGLKEFRGKLKWRDDLDRMRID